MKKLLSVILCVLMLASVAVIPAMAADECTHANTTTVLSKDATLLEDGYSGVVYCYDCHKVISTGGTVDAQLKNNVLHNAYKNLKGNDLGSVVEPYTNILANIEYKDLAVAGIGVAGIVAANVDLTDTPLDGVINQEVAVAGLGLAGAVVSSLDFDNPELEDLVNKQVATTGIAFLYSAVKNADLSDTAFADTVFATSEFKDVALMCLGAAGLAAANTDFDSINLSKINLPSFDFSKVDFKSVATTVAPSILSLIDKF